MLLNVKSRSLGSAFCIEETQLQESIWQQQSDSISLSTLLALMRKLNSQHNSPEHGSGSNFPASDVSFKSAGKLHWSERHCNYEAHNIHYFGVGQTGGNVLTQVWFDSFYVRVRTI